jgi:hypothetical protein
MVAPAIARGELDPPRGRRAPVAAAGEEKKPRRRRSSVYDADGNEVFITLMCLKCHKMRPLAQFGLRRMADGAIRNQPWCRTCRSDASPKARREPAVEESSAAGDSPVSAPSPDSAAVAASNGTLASQVAAALYRGRG